jgi:hypothetical protein
MTEQETGMRSLMNYTLHYILAGWPNQGWVGEIYNKYTGEDKTNVRDHLYNQNKNFKTELYN